MGPRDEFNARLSQEVSQTEKSLRRQYRPLVRQLDK